MIEKYIDLRFYFLAPGWCEMMNNLCLFNGFTTSHKTDLVPLQEPPLFLVSQCIRLISKALWPLLRGN